MDFATARGKAVPRVPLRHGEGNKDHLTSFGGLAALSLDALSSVAYGPEAIVRVLAAARTRWARRIWAPRSAVHRCARRSDRLRPLRTRRPLPRLVTMW
jgi:hypothetical protein